MKLNPLTPEEEQVIIHKWTERPFSGEYEEHAAKGVYVCKRCDAVLYRSSDKFNSGCGWPSFDDCIPSAVKRVADADGRRVEIVCANCNGHLGHVFEGECMTKKNTRHCVNSISLRFIAAEKIGTALFAGGCFWCTESDLRKLEGVLSAVSGYAGSEKRIPNYHNHKGFVEAVQIEYHTDRITFKKLCQFFLDHIDPTDSAGQFFDRGEAYQTAIFYKTEEEKEIAESLIRELEESKLYNKPVTVRVLPEVTFHLAEEEHQRYSEKNPEHYTQYKEGSGREAFQERVCQLRKAKKIEWKK